ncbi:MAG: arylsulfatase [Planctomycetia bacterium]|jgi:arylsulfatase A-like enzyme|nr:arylsulfatase [Planctomycetia bacterium]
MTFRFVLLCAALVLSCTQLSAAERPNIVYLLADDLGYTDVGFHGSEIKTPHLDKLAAAGARLEAFYVQPVCSPTRAALLTGRYPMRHGLQVGVVRPWAQYGLPLEERTLPQALQEAGYFTAICGKWHLGHFQRTYLPTSRGFSHQYGHYNGALDYFTHERDGGFDWHRNDRVCRNEGYTTKLLGDEAVRLIEQQDGNRPFFLYVPFNAPHAPLQALPDYLDKYQSIADQKRRTYAAMVSCVDDQVGRIVAALERRGLAGNTLIAFSSDNGGPLNLGATNGPLRAGKGTLYEGGVRVCAFANWPGQIAPGTVVTQSLHIVDWYPTLLNLAGVPLAQKLPLDGRDAWPTIAAGKPTPHDEILHNTTPGNGAIRVGDWKLVLNGSRGEDGSEALAQPDNQPRKNKKKNGVESIELFNIAEDPNEKTNLAAQQPDKAQDLLARLNTYGGAAVPPKSAPKAPDFQTPKVWGE